MQNIPVIATLPAPQAPVTAPADNGAAQPAESFNSVLARQRSGAGSNDTSSPNRTPAAHAQNATPNATAAPKDSAPANNNETGQTQPSTPAANSNVSAASSTNTQDAAAAAPIDPAISTLIDNALNSISTRKNATQAGSGTTASPLADSRKAKDSTSTVAPDAASVAPGNILAALLPQSAPANSASASTGTISESSKKEKTAAPSATPDGAGALPAGILPITAANIAIPHGTPGAGSAAALPSGIASVAAAPVPASTANKPALATATSPAADATQLANNPAAANGAPAKDQAFSAALGALAHKSEGLSADSTQSASATPANKTPDALQGSFAAPLATAPSSTPAQSDAAAINTPVSHAAWGSELGQKITLMATKHEQTAQLHLNPPNLGPLSVTLKVSGDQASALFVSPHAAVRDAVTQAMPQLRDMLATSGIMLGNATVNDQAPRDQQAFTGREPGGNGNSGLNSSITDTASPVVTVSMASRHQGMVDTFA
jgi:flagellar hook-length control protein FliK